MMKLFLLRSDLYPYIREISNAVYAYYLIGQSYYERISDVARDQKITELALESFVEIIRRYPDTDYARRRTNESRFDYGSSSWERNVYW